VETDVSILGSVLNGKRLAVGSKAGKVVIPLNYNMTFKLKPQSIGTDSCESFLLCKQRAIKKNVFQFTAEDAYTPHRVFGSGESLPSLSINRESSTFSFSTSNGVRNIFVNRALPDNQITLVTIRATGDTVAIMFNKTIVALDTKVKSRTQGFANFFVGTRSIMTEWSLTPL
jgi:hypothetical protein